MEVLKFQFLTTCIPACPEPAEGYSFKTTSILCLIRGRFRDQMGHDWATLGHDVIHLGHDMNRLGHDMNRLGHSKSPQNRIFSPKTKNCMFLNSVNYSFANLSWIPGNPGIVFRQITGDADGKKGVCDGTE